MQEMRFSLPRRSRIEKKCFPKTADLDDRHGNCCVLAMVHVHHKSGKKLPLSQQQEGNRIRTMAHQLQTERISRHTTIVAVFMAMLAPVAALLPAAPAQATVTAPQIRQWVTSHINAELKERGIVTNARQQVSVRIAGVDSRLRLADCEIPVRIDTNSAKWVGRVNSKVTCEGAAPWSIYVPVQIRLMKEVVVANSRLPRGHVVNSQDLRLLQIDITDYPHGYFADVAPVVGKELKRAVAMNNPIAPAHLRQALAIKRGDEVMIVASSGKVAIRSAGIAMSDGRIGQQIRVKNSSSRRIIKARVMQRGLVKVLI